MKGRPKVGEIWVARSSDPRNADGWWLYRIVATLERRGKRSYVGVKDNTDALWANVFYDDGIDQFEEHRLTRRSRQEMDDDIVVIAGEPQ